MWKLRVSILFLSVTMLSRVSFADDSCGEILSKGIFNVTQYSADTRYKADVDSFIYKSEFRTHADANNAGLSIGFPVYDVPITIGGTFSNEQRDTWMNKHQELASDHRSYSDVRTAVMSHVDEHVVDAWRACVTERIKSNTQGLSAGIDPVGRRFVYFWARYRPAADNDRAVVSRLQITGVRELDSRHPALKKGQIVAPSINGVGGTYEIVDQNNVSFTLATDHHGSVSVAFKPTEYADQLAATVQAARLSSAGFIIGEIRTFAFGGGAKDPLIVSLRAQGWLPCNGQELNVLQYPELHNVIGEAWGSNAISISFKIPDLRGMFLRGWDNGAGRDPDSGSRLQSAANGLTGDKVGTYQPDAEQTHSHAFVDSTTLDVSARVCGNHCGALVAFTKNPQPPVAMTGFDAPRLSIETRPKNAFVLFAIYVGRPILKDTP